MSNWHNFSALLTQAFCNRVITATCVEATKKMPPETSGALATGYPSEYVMTNTPQEVSYIRNIFQE